MRIKSWAGSLCLAVSTVLVAGAMAQPCALDWGFNPALNTGAVVFAVALQTNGQILIGGSFTNIGGVPVANVARLNPDGNLDGTFDPGSYVDVGYVDTIAVQPDGKVLVGGLFSSSTASAPGNLARLNSDGSVDLTFDSTLYVDGPVNAIALQGDGGILLGGSFSLVDFYPRKTLARLNENGTLDATFDACVSSTAGAGATGLAALPSGKILASGVFTFSSGAVYRYGIARLLSNGNLDTTFATTQPGIDVGTTAYGLVVRPNGKAMLGGNFTAYALNPTSAGVVQLLSTTGAADGNFNAGTGLAGGTNYTMALQPDGKLLVGGFFSVYNGQSVPSVMRLNTNGSLDTNCVAGTGPNNSVSSFAIQNDGSILVAGKFTSFGGVPRNGLARLYGDQLPPFRLGPPSPDGIGQVQLTFYSPIQASYALETSSNLVAWNPLFTFTATNAVTPLTDSAASLIGPRFYRASKTAK